MAHYAKIVNDIVETVIVVDDDFVNTLDGEWVKTSYNTQAGVHLQDGQPLRKNYAAPGYTYDRNRDAFIPPKPFPSWVLDEQTCHWNAPVQMPIDGSPYLWNEDQLAWVRLERE